MGMDLKLNAMNQITKGTVIFQEGDPVGAIGLVVKGCVEVINNGVKTTIGTGSFVGLCDLESDTYRVTYRSYDDVVLFAFTAKGMEAIERIMAANQEYGSLMVISLNKYVKELGKIYRALVQEAEDIFSFSFACYSQYLETVKKAGYQTTVIDVLEELEPLDLQVDEVKRDIDYCTACCEIPLDTQKAYYRSSVVVKYHVGREIKLVNQIISECMEYALYIYETFYGLMSSEDNCLFKEVMKVAFSVNDAGIRNELNVMVDNIIDRINRIETLFSGHTGLAVEVEREYMESAYFQLISGEAPSADASLALDDSEGFEQDIIDSFDHSLQKILEYSKIEKPVAEQFENLLEEYAALKDKLSTEDKARNLRRAIAKDYYQIYTKVYFRAYKEHNDDKIIDLFLNYGFMDERLMTPEQLVELYHIENPLEKTKPCQVFTIRQWLDAIMQGKREPSKSEMDMDYTENLRERKKMKEITEEQAKRLERDTKEKVMYEINNMLTYNNRVVSGQATVFVPVLHAETFLNTVRKARVTAMNINAAVNRVTQVDFGAFYRQTMYTDPAKHIEKEYIMVEVFPDIILLPTYGTSGIMWQDITGRNRTSAGRFLLPAFCDANLEDIILRLIGKFRWELCRTIQGVQWNDIKTKSLTSEYMDYLQFYRKNHELSEERKEKLKLQIQKARNNSREVFCVDYVLWVKFESQGSVRLNKVVREIMATYCPFSKELRQKVEEQPLFAAAMARYQRDHMKMIKELSLRKRALEKAGAKITPELEKTYKFYETM